MPYNLRLVISTTVAVVIALVLGIIAVYLVNHLLETTVRVQERGFTGLFHIMLHFVAFFGTIWFVTVLARQLFGHLFND